TSCGATGTVLCTALAQGTRVATGVITDAPLVAGTTITLAAWAPDADVTTTLAGIDPTVTVVALDGVSGFDLGRGIAPMTAEVAIDGGRASLAMSLPMSAARMAGHRLRAQSGQAGSLEVYRAFPGPPMALPPEMPALPVVDGFTEDPGFRRATWLQGSGS